MENIQLRQQIIQDTAIFKSEMLAGSWWHSIDLGEGYVTHGVHTLEELKDNYRHFQLPEDLSGKRLLDIGCWDGFYSFEAEKHGAEVFATDCWTPENFFRAKDALNSRVDFQEMSVYEVTNEKLGLFDIVLFLGVLYHLRHPLLALEQICEVTADYALIESHVTDDFFESKNPIMEFYEFDELGGQHDNWWGPNIECLIRMLRAAGFARCHLLRRTSTRALIKAYRRWDDVPDEQSPSLKMVKIMNGTTYDQHFPHRGRQAMIAIWVEGLPEEASRDEVRVEVGGFGINPVYVGPPGGTTRTNQLQVNAPIPPGLDTGPAIVRLWHGNRLSNECEVNVSWGGRW